MKPRINPLPKNKVALFVPYITADELAAVGRAIKSGWLSMGQETINFESAMAKYVGAKYAIATNNGTAALHLAVIAAGIKPGDEVITTPYTFIASTNCILYEKAKPVFADIDPETLNIDVNKLEAKITKKTKAILAVDVFGYPAEWEKIKRLAKKHNLKIIEDAAEALGSFYKGKKLGSLGHLTTFSFFPNKQITTGEGGMIVTNNQKEYSLIKNLVNQGRVSGQFQANHDYLGFNYRMTELSAALGREQLKKIDRFLENRRQAAQWYQEQLNDVAEIKLPQTDDKDHKRSWFVYNVRLNKKINRDKVAAKLVRHGIPVKTYFPSIHLQPHLKLYGYKPGDFPVCEAVSQSTLSLPFYTGIDQKIVVSVCNQLKKALK